jgi:xanthosine utilization system XapX-like protein
MRELRAHGTAALSAYLRLHFVKLPGRPAFILVGLTGVFTGQTLVERCAGLDVHKDTVVACVRITTGTNVETQLATFGTTTVELPGAAGRSWRGRGVTLVGMESTGVYWKPVYYVLEDELGCWLLNAEAPAQRPGP